MTDLADRIGGLAPEKRALLARLLREKPARFNAFPLSFAQRRLWFLDRMDPAGAAYNVPTPVRIRGALDEPALRRALDEVVRRHEVLRSSYAEVDGEPVQVAAPAAPLPLPVDDVSHLPADAREAAAMRIADAEVRAPFDLAKGGLLRARLVRLAADEHRLLLTAHHIVTDGWSVSVLFGELAALYEAFAAGRPSPLPELTLQYADFAAWQREHLRGERMERLEAYWTARMAGAPALLELPTDRPRPAEATFAGRTLRWELGAELVGGLHALARREGASLFMVLAAGFAAVLSRWSGQDDVVVGTPVANRTRAETEGMIGLFANTLALRADLSGRPTLRQLLHRVRATALEAFAHQELPWEKLVELLRTERSLGHHPVFQVMLALQNAEDVREAAGMRLEPPRTEGAAARFDLALSLRERDGGITGGAEYATDLFDGATVERLIGHLRMMLEAMAADADARVDAVELLRGEERARVLVAFNDTAAPAPRAASLHALFERAADAWPDAIAAIGGDEAMSYGELEARANRLAHRLRALGVGTEARVAVCVQRGPDALVALLGVLKAGGAYVPLDPAHPADRLAWMLAECGSGDQERLRPGVVVVAQGAVANRLPPHAGRVLLLEDPALRDEPSTRPAPAPGAGPQSLAYVLYTSGSTGRPKGVLVPHGCVVGIIAQSVGRLDLQPGDRMAQTASLGFDLSVMEIFAPLAAGAAVCTVPAETLASPAELVRTMAAGGITHLSVTPALLEIIPDGALPGVRTLTSGGDRCPPELGARWARGRRFWNLYGPTETALYATGWLGGPDGPGELPIGGPVANVRAYVLDAALRPVPLGVPGELYVGGAGVTRGYHGLPALTAERFVPDAFGGAPGARMYGTGDRVRWRADGTLVFLGRADHQVKIRGFRIEPGEIESALRGHPAVREALVVVRADGGEKRLAGYVVPADGQAPDPAGLRAWLRERLPDYMVPAAWCVLDAFPLGSAGKVDRRALPAPEGARPAAAVPPRTDAERKVAAVWAEVLGVESIGAHEGFFDLGGHSLLLVKVQGRLQEAFGAPVPITHLFRYLTVSALASALEAPAPAPAAPAEDEAGARDARQRLRARSRVVPAGRSPVRPGRAGATPRSRPVPAVLPLSDQGAASQSISASLNRPQDPSMKQSSEPTGLEIAVVGMAGRFPGAPGVDALWANLRAGVESIRHFTDAELTAAGVPDELRADPAYVPARGALDGVDRFDAAFFGFTPREAEVTDPQQRLFLEVAWEAMENAGYDPARVPGRVGVYAGASMSSYYQNLLSRPDVVRAAGEQAVRMGNDKDFLATRAAFKMGLEGPAVVVQTACSTSLVAVHLACQSLLGGDCDMALVGGAAVTAHQHTGYLYQPGSILSPDGHCRAFDADARGTVAGSGVAVAALKRLEDALADGDTVHAVILASAINNDGSAKAGFTAPRVDGQAGAIRAAHAAAGVDPATITYVEAHGTGTELGDPIEIEALTQAFRAGTDRTGFCAIGSAKTNIGHLDVAAGITGFIKTALVLRTGEIPPSLNFQRPNPQIPFAASPFFVNTKLSKWSTEDDLPRRAGVSSFGMGGTNAHVVMEQAPDVAPSAAPARPEQLLVLSARTEAALDAAAARLRTHLEQNPEQPLADVAWTLQQGRRGFAHRRAVVARTHAEAAGVLAGAVLTDAALADAARGIRGQAGSEPPSAVFLFPGQGAQYAGMARGLYDREPVFRAELDACAEILRPHLGLDLRETVFSDDADRLKRTALTQPALFAVEYAVAKQWMHWGIQPNAMLGHSVGEYVAACLAGVFTLEDALALVAERGRLMQALPSGAMLAIPLSAAEVEPMLVPAVSIAAINAPDRCVVAGRADEVARLQAELLARGIEAKRVDTSHAFHSPMMDPILDAFAARVAGTVRNAPALRWVSNLTGTWITPDEAVDPAYWARHLRGAVRFAECVATLAAEGGARVFIEAGPGRTLSSLVKRQVPGAVAIHSLRHPDDAADDGTVLLEALGRAWAAGVEPDWAAVHGDEARRRVPLPTYPFERRRFWIDRAPQPGDATPPPVVVTAEEEDAEPAMDQQRAVWTATERGVARIWATLFGAAPGLHDDFFREGGDSLAATQLVARIRKELGAEIGVRAVFDTPTVAGLAASIDRPAAVDGGLEALLAGVEELSDEEIEALIAGAAGEAPHG
jgi:amino acid adenylation domain-containing protein